MSGDIDTNISFYPTPTTPSCALSWASMQLHPISPWMEDDSMSYPYLKCADYLDTLVHIWQFLTTWKANHTTHCLVPNEEKL